MPPEGGKEVARRYLERWENTLREYRVEAEPLLAEALVYLKENMPETKKLALIHGDYRIGNFIWRDGRIVAMLDWELSEIGDPMADIGWLVMKHWSPDDHSKVSNLLDKDEAYEYYQNMTGEELDEERVRYWRIMEIVKNVAILVAASRVLLDKKSADLRMLTFSVLPFPHSLELCNLLL